MDVLAQAPAALPLVNTAAQIWTQKLLVTYLTCCHEITVTRTTLSKSLRRVGIRWRRAKLRVHSPDPLYVVKRQQALTGTLTSAAAAHPRSDEPLKGTHLVFLDSTDLH